MKSITEIDPNFKLPESIPAGMRFLDAREEPFSIWGLGAAEAKSFAGDQEKFIEVRSFFYSIRCPENNNRRANDQGVYSRLPLEFLPECSEGVQALSVHLAGACVRFSTDADHLAVLWTLTDPTNMPHFTASGQSGLQLFEESDEGIFHVKNLIPAMNAGLGCKLQQTSYFPLPGGMKHYALYLPLYNGLKELLLGFAPDAKVLAGRTPRIEKPILFYGSSITQGGCATKVGSCYSTILCRRLDAAQVNLGFSGNGMGEANMAEYIASTPMSVFVMDYDHNAPNAAHLEKTHEPFYRIIRKAQPDLPIVMVTCPDFERDLQNAIECREVIHLIDGFANIDFTVMDFDAE